MTLIVSFLLLTGDIFPPYRIGACCGTVRRGCGTFCPVRVYRQFTEYSRAAPPFRFSDQLFSDAGFTNWLFLLISCSPSMPLQDAGQLLPATRSQL
ncbi:hypothetical protein [Klebsiella quasipneumoniae]|uniref:hypothetical protein n=1 Tax=Klebsiella quasipneumoniae TaxID=1463165 RepID=UPI001C9385F6|nr:hypothetical protein [Klebsiella quasipneumoniae]MBY5246602.1 hypothetical protein [Klebsiella quasipneumoniae]